MKKLIILLTIVALLCVSGCAGSKDALRKVTLCEVTHSIFYAPLYAAISMGFFEDEGIELELFAGGGADKAMTALISGDADFGLMGAEAAIYVGEGDYDDRPMVIGQLTQRDGSFLVGRNADESFDWSDLEGSTIIGGREGGVPLMTLQYVLEENGLKPGRDIEVLTNIQFDMMGGAFVGGTGDYVTLFEPTASQFEAEGKGHILASVGEGSGEIAYTCFMTKESLIENDPKLVESFIRAIAKGQSFAANATTSEVADAIAWAFPDADAETLMRVVDNYRSIDAWRSDPVVSKTAIDNLQMVMERAGMLDERVDFDELADNSFAILVKSDGDK